MYSSKLKRILAGVTAFAVSVSMITAVSYAEEAEPYIAGDESVIVYPTADIWFRKGNNTDYSISKSFEVRPDTEQGANAHLGGLQFDLSAVDTSDIKKVTLELVTELRDKGGEYLVKPFSDDWSEGSGNKYSDKEEIINTALAAEPIAKKELTYGGQKVFEADKVTDTSKRVLSNWTTEFDVTAYVKEQIEAADTTISMLIAPPTDLSSGNQGASFLSKDAAKSNYGNDARWDNIIAMFSSEISADNTDLLKPRLKIEYLSAAEIPQITAITVSGSERINSFGSGGTYIYTAKVLDQNDSEMQDKTVTWASESSADTGAVEIDGNGVLNVPADAPAQTVRISAECEGVSSDEFTVIIICEDSTHPSEILLTDGVRTRGNGNTSVYETYPNLGETGTGRAEVGMYGAAAAAVLQFDLGGAMTSRDELLSLTLNLETQDNGFERPLGVWLYEAPENDTRTDGKTWSDAAWSNSAAVKNNISLTLGMNNYSAVGGLGTAPGRTEYTQPLVTGSVIREDNVSAHKYAIVLRGENLTKALDYAQAHEGKLNMILTSDTADSTTENRSRLYLMDFDGHRGAYLSVDYSAADRIEIEGTKSIDIGSIDSFPAEYRYTAAVYNQNGDKMQAVPQLSYSTTASSGQVTFDAATGIMTIPQGAAEQTVTISASYKGLSESIEVLIDKIKASSMVIEGADTINNYISVNERTYNYTAKVLDQAGNEMNVTGVEWSYSTNASANAAVFANGVLTIPRNAAEQTIRLTAKYGDLTVSKTVEVKKIVLDLPESFTAVTSMKLRGFGNTAFAVDTDNEEIGMKAAAPALLRFDISKITESADGAVSEIRLNMYKNRGNSIALGMWVYENPNDTQRTDGKSWIDTDWTNEENKKDMYNNYSLLFGIDDFGVRHDSPAKNYAEGRDSYIAPEVTASVSEDKYTFTITGDTLRRVLENAKKNNGMAELVVTSADLDARAASVYLYMTGAAEQYKPTLTVSYDLPSTPRKIEIDGNDTLYINSSVSSYNSRYSAKVYDQSGDLYEDQEVEWSCDLSGAVGVTFNSETGEITVTDKADEGVVLITAKSAFAVGTKTVYIKKIPSAFKNGSFEDTDDSYLANGWTPNVPIYKINFDSTDFYFPWNEAKVNDGGTLFTRTQGYTLGMDETGEIRGTSNLDSTLKMEYSTGLSDEEAEALMNSATQSIGINNSQTEGFLKVGYEIPYYYMMDYYLSPDSRQMLSNQGVYLGMEFRNRQDTGFLASVATGDRIMPFTTGRWRTFTGTFTSGTENQINGQARVNIGMRGMKGTVYVDYFRLVPKGIDTNRHYDGNNSMQVSNNLTWTSDIFSVESGSYYTYHASVMPETAVSAGEIKYTFMDNNYDVKGEFVLSSDSGEWKATDTEGWNKTEGEILIPSGATICEVTLQSSNNSGTVWFDGLVFTKTEEAAASSVRITGGSSELVIPDSGESQYQYTAVVYDQYNNIMSSDVVWTVKNEDGSHCRGIEITANGILKISSSAAEGNIIVSVSKDDKAAERRISVIKKGASKEPESTGRYGFNGSFAENDGSVPYGWTNDGRYVVNYTFDSGLESWKKINTSYGAPIDGDVSWDETQNYTVGVKSGSALVYNPSFNMPGMQIPNDARIQGGMPYEFSLRFKQDKVSDDSTIRSQLRYFNSNGGTIAETPNMLRYYPNDYLAEADMNGWQKWSGIEVVPNNAATVRMDVRFRGGLNNTDGYAWFDDIRISKISGLDSENPYNGNPSLMLVGYNEDKTTTGREYGERWMSDKLNNISQGNSYEYSAMLQTHAADEGAYLSFIFYDANGSELATLKSDRVTGTTNGWTELRGSVTAPVGASSAAVAYNIDGRGTAWIADISFGLMKDTAVSGIKINGASSVKAPNSGSKVESYTISCVNSSGNVIGAADGTITASNLPSGVTFTNGSLYVSSSATSGKVKLSASYMNHIAEFEVTIGSSATVLPPSGPIGGGSGGGITSSGGGGYGGTPMGNVKYGSENTVTDDNNSNQSTAQIPSLLAPPSLDYFTGGEKNVLFDDISGVPWAKNAIETLCRAGVVNGREEHKFVPDETVTRAEFVTMLVKAFKLTSDNKENSFSDVRDTDWYSEYVNIAAGLGIVSGISEDYFGAEENISRQDIAVMCVRMWNGIGKEMTGRYKATFTDYDQVSQYALDAVTSMAEAGILNGNENGAFAPSDNATRAEAAVIIYRMAVKYDE